MASASGSRHEGVTGRIRNAATTLHNDNISLVGEIRRALGLMKEIAVDLEKANQSQMVKKLEDAAIQLVEAYAYCTHHSSAIESIGNSYQPGPELTDFKKLLEDEAVQFKATSTSDPQKDPHIRQFREAVWNVHHAGEPMPGEEQEDIIMTSTQCNLLNITCPLSGKPITELAEPVRSVECKHIYDKEVIMAYIKSKNANARCPVAGCPKKLQASKVVCDTLLLVEIDEMRRMSKQSARTDVIEDFTALDDLESE
ncbi:E3 SUMO-protein ligase MMS21 [Melia azedarach]|uniref:E3 SUMO-protein ligase MMS21 n=1 Tax=Melia azedarach TaxID=155640 RepID=A0ACC1YSP5_MELAZ|nr:E3 SUMO-protein ligase MMS21 [Melia azedarach]